MRFGFARTLDQIGIERQPMEAGSAREHQRRSARTDADEGIRLNRRPANKACGSGCKGRTRAPCTPSSAHMQMAELALNRRSSVARSACEAERSGFLPAALQRECVEPPSVPQIDDCRAHGSRSACQASGNLFGARSWGDHATAARRRSEVQITLCGCLAEPRAVALTSKFFAG
jgi:hypothetical protein